MSGTIRRLLILGVFVFGAMARAGVETAYDPYGSARVLDPIGDIYSRAQVKGAYRSTFGMQVHPSCMKNLEQNYGIPKEVAEKRLEATIRVAVEKVLSCRAAYPELSGYIGDWISHARRAIVACAASERVHDRGAMNPALGLGISIFAESSAVEGIDDIAPFDSTAHGFRTVILSSLASYDLAQTETPSTDSVDMVVHEVFHDTILNNNGATHDRIERIRYDDEDACAENTLDDRVHTVSALCSGLVRAVKFDNKRIERILFRRMGKCGMRRGCVDLFAGEGITNPVVAYYAPSKSLSEKTARSLCGRIQEAGACLELQYEKGAEAARSNPVLVAYGKGLEKRLDQLFPRYHNDIPIGLLEAFPSIHAGLRSLSQTPCFKAIFTQGKDGTLYLRKRTAEGTLRPGERAFSSHESLKLEGVPESCGSNGGGGYAVDLLFNLREKLRLLQENPLFLNLLAARAVFGRVEPYYADVQYHPENVRRNELFRSTVGPALIDGYLAALKKYHADSPDFDCKAAAKPGASVTDLIRAQALIDGALDPKEASCPAK